MLETAIWAVSYRRGVEGNRNKERRTTFGEDILSNIEQFTRVREIEPKNTISISCAT